MNDGEEKFKVGDDVRLKGGTVVYPVVATVKRSAGWVYIVQSKTGAKLRLTESHLEAA